MLTRTCFEGAIRDLKVLIMAEVSGRIVNEGINSALILEDDADWDVRLKRQLRSFALATTALTQPLEEPKRAFADSSFPDGTEAVSIPAPLSTDALPLTVVPETSPYGVSLACSDCMEDVWFTGVHRGLTVL